MNLYPDLCTKAGVHVHYIFELLGQYLASIVLDKRERGIYGNRKICQSDLITFCDLSIQASQNFTQLVTHVNCYCTSAKPT